MLPPCATAMPPAPAPTPPTAPPLPSRRRWPRRLLIGGLVLLLLVTFHAPLLRGLAGFLVVDDPLIPTDAVIVAGTSGPYAPIPFDELATMYQQGYAPEIVLIEDRSSRIVQAGIVPTLETVLRRELATRGIPEQAQTVRSSNCPTTWDKARLVRDWLDEHPGSKVTMLLGQFESRGCAYIFATVLGPERTARVRWHALADQRYDTTNWWRNRQGLVELGGAYVSLGHAWMLGEPPQTPRRWDPDAYEQQLREGTPP